MKLNAYVDRECDGGFLLKDEDLTKLLDVIKVRAKEVEAEEDIVVKVYRGDGLVYADSGLEMLRNEENAVRNEITEIHLIVDSDSLKMSLSFSKKEKVVLRIEGDDKDRVHLLFSELKEYLNTEVLSLPSYRADESPMRWVYVFMAVYLSMMVLAVLFAAWSGPDVADHQAVVKSDDLHSKLNFLIEKSEKTADVHYLLWMPLLAIPAVLIFAMMFYWRRYFYPSNVFCLGKEIRRYNKILDLRAKVLWVVGVGLVISIVGGMIVWLMTKA